MEEPRAKQPDAAAPTTSAQSSIIIPQADDDSRWPMVVWLRGDETYFEQFSANADRAMTALGIKRSRLTQISGNDLRVGRVRQGRYIKPVYREKDLKAYINWVRPTATHRKSAAVLGDATQELTNESVKFRQSLSNELKGFMQQTHRLLGEETRKNAQTLTQITSYYDKMIENLEISLMEKLLRTEKLMMARLAESDVLVTNLEDRLMAQHRTELGIQLKTLENQEKQETKMFASFSPSAPPSNRMSVKGRKPPKRPIRRPSNSGEGPKRDPRRRQAPRIAAKINSSRFH